MLDNDLKRSITQIEIELRKLRDERGRLEEATNRLPHEIAKIRQRTDKDIPNELREHKDAIRKLDTEKGKLRNEEGKLTRELNSMSSQLPRIENEIRQYEQQLQDLLDEGRRKT